MEHGNTDLNSYLKTTNHPYVYFDLFKKMTRIMKKLYDLRIVHADLKPANLVLMFSENFNETEKKYKKFKLKLIDFGISRETPSNTTSIIQEEKIGTINYISPEKINKYDNNGKQIKYNRSSDIWSFGMILFEMIQKESVYSKMNLREFFLKFTFLNSREEIKFCECLSKYENNDFSDLIIENNDLSDSIIEKNDSFIYDPSFHIIVNSKNEKPFCSEKCDLNPYFGDKLFFLRIIMACLRKNPSERINIDRIIKLTIEHEKRRVFAQEFSQSEEE